MIFVVGITGSIGSGKSTLAHFFAELDAPIIDADKIAKDLVAPGSDALNAISRHFGKQILENGDLNRKLLREIVFNNLSEKKWLEDLLHPLIYQEMLKQIEAVTFPYCVAIIPLLVEKYDQYQKILDHVIVIDAPLEQQIAWAMERDKCSRDMVNKIMNVQASTADRLKIADTVILNDGDLQQLKNKVKDLHNKFLKASSAI